MNVLSMLKRFGATGAPVGGCLAAAAVLVLSAGLSGPAQAQEDDDMLRVAIHADIPSANPGVNRDFNADTVLAHVVEGLVAYADDLSIKPMLAESWTVNDDSTVYDFKLREGVPFHNGEAVKAEHIVWNFERYLDPETNFQCAARYNGGIGWTIADIEAVDDHTVRFTFDAPAPHFLIIMATQQCTPWILHPDSVAEDGSFVEPIGTGPYMFDRWESGRYIDLRRFQDYAALPGEKDGYAGNKTGIVDTVRFMIVPDASTRVNGLLAGELDVIGEVEATAIDDLRAEGVQISVQPTPAWMMLQVQSESPKLSDVRMRRAVAHAIDLEQLAEAAGEGLYPANPSVIPPQSLYRTERTSVWPEHDIEEAKALLQAAGYEGEPINLLVANRENRVQIATIIQAMLNAAGINAPLEVRDWATQLDLYRSGKYELALFAYSARLDPLLMFQSLIGDKTAEPTRQWDDDQAAALLKEVSGVTDVEQRRKLFNDLHELMAEQVPLIGLFNLSVIAGLGPDIEGYAGWPGGTHRFWGVSKSSD